MSNPDDPALDWIARGRRKLRNHGGPGDHRVARIGDAVLTIEHGVAVDIARRTVAALELTHDRPIHDIPLVVAHAEVTRRIVGRVTTLGQVMAEVGRIRNRSERDHGSQ